MAGRPRNSGASVPPIATATPPAAKRKNMPVAARVVSVESSNGRLGSASAAPKSSNATSPITRSAITVSATAAFRCGTARAT
jgi:hypothetical protein